MCTLGHIRTCRDFFYTVFSKYMLVEDFHHFSCWYEYRLVLCCNATCNQPTGEAPCLLLLSRNLSQQKSTESKGVHL